MKNYWNKIMVHIENKENIKNWVFNQVFIYMYVS